MKNIFLFLFFMFFVCAGFSQQLTILEDNRGIYEKETMFGIKMHTSGWGVFYRNSNYNHATKKTFYVADFLTVSHPKEEKAQSLNSLSSEFKFGKLNSIMVLRLGRGRQKVLYSKQSVKGVEVSYILSGGLSFTYAKPIYLDIAKRNMSEPVTEKYDPNKHDISNIVRSSSWFKGFTKGRFYPGIFVKSGLLFETSLIANKINAVELGLSLDLYLNKIPMLAYLDNKFFYFNAYVALVFGNKK